MQSAERWRLSWAEHATFLAKSEWTCILSVQCGFDRYRPALRFVPPLLRPAEE
jgi:hypothetical protein